MMQVRSLELSTFPHLTGQWLRGVGPDSDVVISSRIRLARNLKGSFYPARLSAEERQGVVEQVSEAIRGNAIRADLVDFSRLDRAFLVERRLISKELAGQDGASAVIFGRSESISIMVNEEDHLRVQCLRSGFSLERIWRALSQMDIALERELPFQFHDRFGYLTACPSNTGTGMRVSVMLHLPALVLRDEIGRVHRAADAMNLTLRGLYGEGTQPAGDFYQVSNQATLGRSEPDIVEMIRNQIPHIIGYERGLREALLQHERPLVEDRVQRALANLKAARQITVEETLRHMSMIRLGLSMGLIPADQINISDLNELLILSQPAHLQKREGRSMTGDERDVIRAELLRSRLNPRGTS
jgi:protein arginine kinase